VVTAQTSRLPRFGIIKLSNASPGVRFPEESPASVMSLATRRLQPELMDAPDVAEGPHRHALAGLGRINRLSLSAAILWPALRELAKSQAPRPLRVLDLACGGGDVLCDLLRRATRQRLRIEAHGIDRSPVAIDTATRTALRAGVSPTFSTGDVLKGEWPGGMDVVMCSLFLHHLENEEVVRLLTRMREAAGRSVLANDLVRSRAGYWLAWCGCRLLTRSPIVHVDGPRSVEGAFTPTEIRDLATRAGLSGLRCTRHWPQRFLLRRDCP
jgi:2-polyprenyl-3-methyl-5-hydroxy-6-metoxy-1,4-benzoquinol methylase